MNYFHLKKQAGFSLVETLVAISVLLIVMVGPMSVTSRTAKSATFATEQVQAFFLAQEGLELAEQARDSFILEYFEDSVANPSPWTDFITQHGTCYVNDGCGLEWQDNSIIRAPIDCSLGTKCRLNFEEDVTARSRFTYQAADSVTPFTRKIKFVANGAESVAVTSTVTWRTGSLIAEQRVETSTYLYNIYDL